MSNSFVTNMHHFDCVRIIDGDSGSLQRSLALTLYHAQLHLNSLASNTKRGLSIHYNANI